MIKVTCEITISALETTSDFVPFKFMDSFDRYIKWKLQIFDTIASVNTAADSANGGCQLEKLPPCRKREMKIQT